MDLSISQSPGKTATCTRRLLPRGMTPNRLPTSTSSQYSSSLRATMSNHRPRRQRSPILRMRRSFSSFTHNPRTLCRKLRRRNCASLCLLACFPSRGRWVPFVLKIHNTQIQAQLAVSQGAQALADKRIWRRAFPKDLDVRTGVLHLL
jgi:hypothetical protein